MLTAGCAALGVASTVAPSSEIRGFVGKVGIDQPAVCPEGVYGHLRQLAPTWY
jgi:hypothetical protein